LARRSRRRGGTAFERARVSKDIGTMGSFRKGHGHGNVEAVIATLPSRIELLETVSQPLQGHVDKSKYAIPTYMTV